MWLIKTTLTVFFYCLTIFLSACGGGSPNNNEADDKTEQISQDCGSAPCKPLPAGIYESAGPNDPVGNAVDSTALQGVLVRISWKACGDDLECLLDMIQEQLDKALTAKLLVSLIVMDGDEAPDGVKSRCTTFDFEKRGIPASMCLAWDANYLTDKIELITAIGQRFDQHPALSYIYFTGACSTNGAEGHCRVDENAYSAAGYTPDRLSGAYLTIMDSYRQAFPTTPIAFEVHAIFNSATLWQNVWDHVADSGRVGVAAWWCSERLSLNGNDTTTVWPIVQAAAQTSFSVCQTVGNFTEQPYRFSDSNLGLDYGLDMDWNENDSSLAFNESLDWIQGFAVHAGQSSMIKPFSVVETWTTDLNNAEYQPRLLLFE